MKKEHWLIAFFMFVFAYTIWFIKHTNKIKRLPASSTQHHDSTEKPEQLFKEIVE